MKSFALFILSFLFVAGLMLSVYSDDIQQAQHDFQAFQTYEVK